MKSIIKFFTIILIISSCNQSAKQVGTLVSDSTTSVGIDSTKHYNVNDFKFNKSKYKVDTALNEVLIDDKMYSFLALRTKDKANATQDDGGIPYDITFVFIDPSTNKSVIFKQLNLVGAPANIYSIFKKKPIKLNEKGDLYITASLIAGGSGGQEALYDISLKNNKIIFNKLFDYSIGMHSTTEIYFNKNKNEILKIDGMPSTIDPDVDLNSQRCTIEKYDRINDKYIKSIVGQTKYKYDFSEDGSSMDFLNQINSKEPNSFKSIDTNEFE